MFDSLRELARHARRLPGRSIALAAVPLVIFIAFVELHTAPSEPPATTPLAADVLAVERLDTYNALLGLGGCSAYATDARLCALARRIDAEDALRQARRQRAVAAAPGG